MSEKESIECIDQIIKVGKKKCIKFENKFVINLIGNTGTGKSVCANYFLGNKLKWGENEIGDKIIEIDNC